ncbi:hypothetical protein C7H19_14295 [Aphanothece hegewaldii CCALA 016]|uniref:Uncharacterized protein n=1 Tax=Aphanothece hegewaldii CCALA 016 TaxID=2107694 RepID=A0A2T1LWF9_9CHRO|nr:hypothetical protein [Aphanothece hegewaldii]PSF36163.1 hypothetical protein C7H19_14295 [Aphanothece hegewaldii CCALA 016]
MSSQFFFDPRDPRTSKQWTPEFPISPSVRAFGFYPNLQDLLPADLILVSNIKPNFSHKIIEKVQLLGGYSQDDARWHHAAIYVGDAHICEADLPGVECRIIERYLTGSHLIRVRRDMSLSIEQRWRIAIRSLTRLRQRYAFEYLLDLGKLALSGFGQLSPDQTRLPEKAKICSQLYADAYSPITGKVLQNLRSGEITPAFLSFTNQLTDVPVEWLKIEKF